MSTPSRPARAGQRLRRSALGVTLAGVIAVGVALPATAASAATPAPAPGLPATAGAAAPAPGLATATPRPRPPRADGKPGQGRALPVQPQGGVDTGAGGTQPDTHSGTEAAVPLAAGGAGLGVLAGFGLWRRRRAGALG
ncbi:conserved exported hypothetical protein [Frankia canadensis]|uniref:Uncharacterized protein n=1 Tax=Frankia canadensis TaxID=1836972 RepID=A0A2I2KUN0_9ACTN|nr:hypothetical protein [Frankia canadensis]SNQ49377.1 conserved exported hypothetical protein [Frankia canadensis]SOU56667.1 conserved exported hypothetical protein [Frankia canadensis]